MCQEATALYAWVDLLYRFLDTLAREHSHIEILHVFEYINCQIVLMYYPSLASQNNRFLAHLSLSSCGMPSIIRT